MFEKSMYLNGGAIKQELKEAAYISMEEAIDNLMDQSGIFLKPNWNREYVIWPVMK